MDENNPVGEKWFYTSVPVNYNFPSVRYDIMEGLFLPEDYEEETSENARKASSAFLFSLEEEALALTENLDGIPKMEYGTNARRPKRHPQGFVTVVNTTRNANEGVEDVRVRTRRWFKYGYAYTNQAGFYRINKDYRRPVHYSVIFVNRSGFKIWNSMIDIDPALHHVGKHTRDGHDIHIWRTSRAWRFATVNNAVVNYRSHCAALGVRLPPSDLRIAASNRTGRQGAAPMLRRTYGIVGFTTNSSVATFFLKANSLSI